MNVHILLGRNYGWCTTGRACLAVHRDLLMKLMKFRALWAKFRALSIKSRTLLAEAMRLLKLLYLSMSIYIYFYICTLIFHAAWAQVCVCVCICVWLCDVYGLCVCVCVCICVCVCVYVYVYFPTTFERHIISLSLTQTHTPSFFRSLYNNMYIYNLHGICVPCIPICTRVYIKQHVCTQQD